MSPTVTITAPLLHFTITRFTHQGCLVCVVVLGGGVCSAGHLNHRPSHKTAAPISREARSAHQAPKPAPRRYQATTRFVHVGGTTQSGCRRLWTCPRAVWTAVPRHLLRGHWTALPPSPPGEAPRSRACAAWTPGPPARTPRVAPCDKEAIATGLFKRSADEVEPAAETRGTFPQSENLRQGP